MTADDGSRFYRGAQDAGLQSLESDGVASITRRGVMPG